MLLWPIWISQKPSIELTVGFRRLLCLQSDSSHNWWRWTEWEQSLSFCLERFVKIVLALESILCKLRENSVVRGFTIPGTTIPDRFTPYGDDVSASVTRSVKVDVVSKAIRRREDVTAAKIYRRKSVGLRLGSRKCYDWPGPFGRTDGV